jgi:hypothetical protein
MATRNEIRKMAAEIRRYAVVAGIKRRALNPAPIPDDPREPLPRQKKLRAVLVFPARYSRLLRSCMCLRVR